MAHLLLSKASNLTSKGKGVCFRQARDASYEVTIYGYNIYVTLYDRRTILISLLRILLFILWHTHELWNCYRIQMSKRVRNTALR